MKTVIKKTKDNTVSTYITAYDIYKANTVSHLGFTGVPSIAARHTAIEYGAIQLDCGYMPREVGKNKLLVLITHFHSDHGSDICNCIGYDNRVTIFVPAFSALNLFNKIKCDISMQKGRQYTDEEIVKMVRIIGCKKDNDEFNNISTILSQDTIIVRKSEQSIYTPEKKQLVIVELISMGDKIIVPLRGRDEVMIEPFQCYHTVDTCGYAISEVRKKLVDNISYIPNSTIEVNFTEDQQKNENAYDDWHNDPKYQDIIEFSKRHNVKITPEIIDRPVTPKYTLKVRSLHFPDGININTKLQDECIMNTSDFKFLHKYKINLQENHYSLKTVFFGDTCSYVFNKQNTRIHELIETAETVIIEATFLEDFKEMSKSKYKERYEKKHMFLFELYQIFKAYPDTQFLLIHFSACYDKETIQKYISLVNKYHDNVVGFI
jgi:ribonuclease BN (tRNA processing enzyme)